MHLAAFKTAKPGSFSIVRSETNSSANFHMDKATCQISPLLYHQLLKGRKNLEVLRPDQIT